MSITYDDAGAKAVYKALISQSETDAPSETPLLVNSLGGTPVWSYNSPGSYSLTLMGAFAGNVFFYSPNLQESRKGYLVKVSNDVIILNTDGDIFNNACIEIHVYPS